MPEFARDTVFPGDIAAMPGLGEACRLRRPPRQRGPAVFLDYDQAELDAAYDQDVYEAHIDRSNERLAHASREFRARWGQPDRIAYGRTSVEHLDIYRTDRTNAPVFIFIHGGSWRFHDASGCAFAAEMFLEAGAHFVALDFADVRQVHGDLGVLAAQVRRAIARIASDAAGFGGNPHRLYVGGHSSGAHLCAVALTTDWQDAFGLPADTVRGGLCMSGIYDLAPVRLSSRREYIAFTDAMEAELSPQRRVGRIRCPVVVSWGTFETPEFQRQGTEFAAALRAAGNPVEQIIAGHHHHQDMWESLGNPYGVNGRAALRLMGLHPR